MAKSTTEETKLKKLQKSRASKFKIAITNIDNVLRDKYIHRNKLESTLESDFDFYNVVFSWDANDVCYDNARYTNWHTNYPDALIRLELRSYRKVPWYGRVPFILGDFMDEHGHPLHIYPHQLLKKVIARAENTSYYVLAA